MTTASRSWLSDNFLALAQTILLVGTIAVWAVGKGALTDQNQSQITQLRDDLSGQIRELKTTVQQGQTALQAQIQDLPTDRAQLAEHGREITTIQRTIDVLSDRIGGIDGRVIQLRSDLDNVTRASSVPLLPGRAR